MAFVGSVVSIDCGDVLGTYQGVVSGVDNDENTLTITQPFRNGTMCPLPKVTISASDIKELKLLKNSTEAQAMPEVRHRPSASPAAQRHPEGNVAPARAYSAELRPEQRSSPMESQSQVQKSKHRRSPMKGVQSGETNGTCRTPKQKDHNYDDDGVEGYRYHNGLTPTKLFDNQNNSHNSRGSNSSTPRKIENRRDRHTREDCFSAPVDTFLGDDFDFEKNLALFDKKAVFREIEGGGVAEIVKAGSSKQPAKYKHDENVLESRPAVYQQIQVNGENVDQKYVTDSGLVVPCVSYQTRSKLLLTAEKCGLSKQRQLELVGRSASEMVMQLVGGISRLNPKNAHQRPTAVVLCGPHIQGAQGVNCARHLANHNVDVTVFVPNFVKVIDDLEEELHLFELTSGVRTSSVKDLNNVGLDIIVTALDNHENRHLLSGQGWYKTMSAWANASRAPVLSIDPPVEGSSIGTKWCLSPALPLALSERCGQLYLCDLGIPTKVFRECAITYLSPFANKFVVPLHLGT